MVEHSSREGSFRNRLQFEKSPYLLQHAANPVDWYPWGEEAFEKARLEDKPVFLSIGYSTCHWCHVMAHESFENEEVARLLNENFVSIKVDREERPDIDKLYMTVCQVLTGGGGWPLTIMLTPDRRPFYAATYIPREGRPGMAGMLALIPGLGEVWRREREKVLDSVEEIEGVLQRMDPGGSGEIPPDAVLRDAYDDLRRRFDERYGGFGSAPKFPMAEHLFFLLRYADRTGESPPLAMVEKTLEAMRQGGIYDSVGFGFHRYSTDAQWRMPHFEKMLYDQALMALAYTEAFSATGRAFYERTAREILTYVLRDMTAPGGGFYAAEDADTAGEEGAFYLWKVEELRQVLAPEEADLLIRAYDLQAGGRAQVLHCPYPRKGLAEMLNVPEERLSLLMESAREKLYRRRLQRIRPLRDDKILTDWNGLMIAAMARAAFVFEDPLFLQAAGDAVSFILGNLRDARGRLLHRWRDGEAAMPASVDDYAFVIWGLIEAYEAVFDGELLQVALSLQEEQNASFWDRESGGYYFTPEDGEPLLIRQKESYDGAIPSGNAVAMLNLLRLARLTGRVDLEERAVATGKAFAAHISSLPAGHTQFLVALDYLAGPSAEVVIAGNADGEDTRGMLRELRRAFLPRTVVLLSPGGVEKGEHSGIPEFARGMTPVNGRAAAYVCRNFSCRQPTTDPADMMAWLRE
ncbi:thioredoxin domain-containing protein [Syntrophus buswellii]|uniref:thioredoxin domain-containing protein n=1 Tax=Syntrophus TaxID=43773 RepID=UPI00345E23A4